MRNDIRRRRLHFFLICRRADKNESKSVVLFPVSEALISMTDTIRGMDSGRPVC